MSSAAVITLVGNVGRDPEQKTTGSGKPVVEFSVAHNQWSREGDEARWYRVSVWGKRGESVRKYLRKGAPVTVVGELTVREYEHNGQRRYSLEIRADHVAWFRAPESRGDGPPRDRGNQRQQRAAAAREKAQGYDADEEIPF